MSQLARRLNRPEFAFHPSAILRRLAGKRSGAADLEHVEDARLPWGQTIAVFPDDLGISVSNTGIFDVGLTETIHRLLDPGGVAVDVGANVGYVANLMATRVGPSGKVIAFEPHPMIFRLLKRNVDAWNAEPCLGELEAHRIAVSDRSGKGRLAAGLNSDSHLGLATLREEGEPVRSGDGDIDVQLSSLDSLLGDNAVQLLKIDVEGHEQAVLEGAARLLAERRVRDIVFEDHGIYPTPVMTLLERSGMTIFTLDHSLLGLRIHPVSEGPAPPGWPGPDYLATFEPDRAVARLRPRGWRSLARRRRRPAQ